MTRRILLDVTRTISRTGLGAATGIDRVEQEWIDWALSPHWEDAQFIARLSGGLFTVDADFMRRNFAAGSLAAASERLDLRGAIGLKKRRQVRQMESAYRRQSVAPRAGAIYFNVGHSNLAAGALDAIRDIGAAKTIVKLHDVIPLEHPEFARPDGPAKMRERLLTAREADGLIFNSADTRERAVAHMVGDRPSVIAPLGVRTPQIEASAHGGFVILGTVEPRKNHLMLLDIWKEFAATASPPPLHIVGRRGWLNDAVFSRLDKAPAGVIEHGDLPDDEAMCLLGGARALLFPSFAEGYGLPLVEALALEVPAIASDIPALREVGGVVPDFIKPGDKGGWRDRILQYANSDAPAAAQAARRRGWRAPNWRDHFAAVEELLNSMG